MVSFVYTPVECLFYKFYGINCRPKSSAKLLDRFFHRRRQPLILGLPHTVAAGMAGFAGWAATTSWPPWLACVWLLI